MNDVNLDNLNDMSDEELQEAFASGRLKPGLNVLCEEKEYKNNVDGLKLKLKDFASSLNWIEKLDLVSTPAPMPPEVLNEFNLEKSSKIVKLKNHLKFKGQVQSKDVVDDFKREMLFHRQAQSAVLDGVTRLKSLGILTKRPDDYFAEMAKSDQHMHKVRESLVTRQTAAAMSEKVKELRRLKKIGKEAQVQAKLKQASEKKKMLNEVKKFKKGLRNDLSFLDDDKESKGKSKKGNMKSQKKRALRDEKFGFGGKKKGSKRNTKASTSGSFTKIGKKSGAKVNKRLGKSKRLKKKSRK